MAYATLAELVIGGALPRWGAKEAAVTVRGWVGLCGLVWLVGGCATTPLPGGAGEVRGALQSIDLYPARSSSGQAYPTAGRQGFFASDREVSIGLRWALPGPGNYVTKVALRTPAGAIHGERELPTSATTTEWFTGYRLALPQGGDAKALAGVWQVEVSLDGVPVGRRAFTFDPRDIRLRTAARLLILQGRDEPEAASGDWFWPDRSGVLVHLRTAHAILGVVLRDELARRFPQVEGPQPAAAGADATILVRTNLAVSPNMDMPSRLTIEVVHVPTQSTRAFQFQSWAGTDRVYRRLSFGIAAADLAFRAAADPEFLQCLATTAQAVPE